MEKHVELSPAQLQKLATIYGDLNRASAIRDVIENVFGELKLDSELVEMKIVIGAVLNNPHTDDMTDQLQRWGEWLQERIQLEDCKAFYRIAVLIGALTGRTPKGEPNDKHPQPRQLNQITRKELLIKGKRGPGPTRKRLFAECASSEILSALNEKRMPRREPIWNAVKARVAASNKASPGEGISPMLETEFSRCVKHFGLRPFLPKRSSKRASPTVTARSER